MKRRSLKYYERQLRLMIEKRIGKYDEFLDLQVRTAAQCLQMLDRIQDDLMLQKSLVILEVGSQSQTKNVTHPLLVTYRDLQRTMIQHYAALGLNYQATPSKMTESTKKGGDIDNDPMAAYLNATK